MPNLERSRLLQHQIAFLRMAAIEMRNIADQAREVATPLRYMADQMEAEAADLLRQLEDR
ncbi:MAG: hypothetical protein JO213_14955 [Alphaproteobacteria bacterium]|nr:hypothetical protein [Alphaproteobacteria bacterium]MBV9586173.1 hypothetical protein [Alphaproteobacteria bacterium]MBV9964375.1 hypothetical protein [Alphaproteobacteria bacterium]